MQSLNASEMSDGLARIRARFVDELRVRHARLVELRSHVGGPDQSHSALMEIGQINHKIAGTAATLGFPELGVRAGAIDSAIDQKNMAVTRPMPEVLDMIDRMISEMEC